MPIVPKIVCVVRPAVGIADVVLVAVAEGTAVKGGCIGPEKVNNMIFKITKAANFEKK